MHVLGLGIVNLVINYAENPRKMGKSYGMELPRVGAFTEKWGSGYRKPVQILGENRENHVFLGFWGLV